MILKLKSFFSSAHFYHQPKWSNKKNMEHFGKCYTPFGHGHNYTLEVDFKVNSESPTREKAPLQSLIDSLTKKLDHEHLNFNIEFFKERTPTTENIALYFYDQLKFSTEINKVVALRVWEMNNLWVEVRNE